MRKPKILINNQGNRRKNLFVGVHHKVVAEFTIQKFNAAGEITYQGKPFPNLVLNNGLDNMADTTIYECCSYCNVGDGNTVPAVTDTGLTSHVASSNTTYGSVPYGGTVGPPMYGYFTRTWLFAIGTFSGDNLAEVGLSKSSNSSYFNRQLIKDIGGSPTTITVLSDEGLRVTATIRVYSDIQVSSPETGYVTETASGITYEYERTVVDDTFVAYNALYPVTSPIPRTNIGYYPRNYTRVRISSELESGYSPTTPATTNNMDAYVPGNYYLTGNAVWSAESFSGDVNYIYFVNTYGGSGSLISILEIVDSDESPFVALNKSDVEEMTINFKVSWGRY